MSDHADQFDILTDALERIDRAHPYSQDHLAEIFVEYFGPDWRYVDAWKQWLRWDGHRWEKDKTLLIVDQCRRVVGPIVANEGSGIALNSKRSLCSAGHYHGMIDLIKSKRPCRATVEQWEQDPWSFAVPDGIIDLRSGSVRQAVREDYIMHKATVSPGGACPIWLSHLDTITGGDIDLQSYLQRAVGYTLTGSNAEHAFFFCYGSGANGKSVFLDTIFAIMGGYAKAANIEMFLASKVDRPTHEVADLMGARFVLVDEVKKSRAFDESRINRITSAKTLTACRKYEHPFEFTPRLKLWFAGNEKPELTGGVDEAIRRRVHIIPFRFTIPEAARDSKFSEKLQQEYPGILAWMLEGCAEWQRVGLAPSTGVMDATDEYLKSEDPVSAWLHESCELTTTRSVIVKDLYANYKAYCEALGERPMSCKRLLGELKGHGCRTIDEHGLRCLEGLRLR